MAVGGVKIDQFTDEQEGFLEDSELRLICQHTRNAEN